MEVAQSRLMLSSVVLHGEVQFVPVSAPIVRRCAKCEHLRLLARNLGPRVPRVDGFDVEAVDLHFFRWDWSLKFNIYIYIYISKFDVEHPS